MATFNELILLEHESEHDLEHDLAHKKEFSDPKIYTANGNLSKRWYVYYSFRHPETGKLKRMKNIYGAVNTYKTKEDRLSLLTGYRRRLLKLLKDGYNPYHNNTALYQSTLPENNLKAKATESKQTDPQTENRPVFEAPDNSGPSLREAFDYSLQLKDKTVNERTLKDYLYSSNALVKWVKNNRPEIQSIQQLNKKVAMDFLNDKLLKTSSRNRNNIRLNLSSLMQTLVDNEIILSNPMGKIRALRTIPQRNKCYTKDTQEKIFEYLKMQDPVLLLYIKFISYVFVRPIEACRLKVKDLDFTNNTFEFKAKNKSSKTKIIPRILLESLPDLTASHPDSWLFTPGKIGGTWDTQEENKRNYFTKRFKQVVKEPFNLGPDYGLYSFKHTYTTILYRALLEKSSPYAAKSELMEITGHSTMEALEKYLRDIDAYLPDDYSYLYENED
ncbi:site-specific integrase [Gaetbulibacter aquiaggeris]|uniref:Site-specific integrase n=1 Tax=Gaetbulibacter aquiaggeris TaxID=1735373 RepID=A0ABW7MSF4_9FLAO